MPELPISIEELLNFPVDEFDKQIIMEYANSFTYHAPSDLALEDIRDLRTGFLNLALLVVKSAPNSRSRAIALTNLETALMYAVKAIVTSQKKQLMLDLERRVRVLETLIYSYLMIQFKDLDKSTEYTEKELELLQEAFVAAAEELKKTITRKKENIENA